MMEIPNWIQNVQLTSFQLLMAGGVLLIFAAILLGLRRRSRVQVESSIVTEELMAYLARIANALETPRTPTGQEIADQILRRAEERANDKRNGKVREMPFSM